MVNFIIKTYTLSLLTKDQIFFQRHHQTSRLKNKGHTGSRIDIPVELNSIVLHPQQEQKLPFEALQHI